MASDVLIIEYEGRLENCPNFPPGSEPAGESILQSSRSTLHLKEKR